jgi:hypothetical protein
MAHFVTNRPSLQANDPNREPKRQIRVVNRPDSVMSADYLRATSKSHLSKRCLLLIAVRCDSLNLSVHAATIVAGSEREYTPGF